MPVTVHALDGRTVTTLGGTLDHHDLQPLPGGKYLAERYVPRQCPAVPSDCADLSPWGGPTSANVVDAEVVVLDARNRTRWSWRTRDHIALAESADWLPSIAPVTAGDPWDIVHLNSVQPDGNHAFLFSARHLDALYHVDMTTGAIDWKLGGTPTPQSLTVVGATGPGPLFSGQHDARLLPDGTLTAHDNGTMPGRLPRALRFRIDTVHRTATLLESITDPRTAISGCCGSARRLAHGDWVMAWGLSPIVTELDPQGNPVLTITFANSHSFNYRAVPVEPGRLSAPALRAGMNRMAAATP